MAKEKVVKADLSTDIKSFRVKAKLLTPMLGTAPEDPNLYTAYLIEKALKTEYADAKTKGDTARVDKAKAGMLAQELAKHADAGLPFLAIEFDPATYQVETPVDLSRMPTYDDIEATNLEGSNAYDAASYRHLLAIAVGITGVTTATAGTA